MISYLVSINGSAGAFVPLPAKSKCRGVSIIEDGSGAAQGVSYQYADGSTTPFGTTFSAAAGVNIQIGDCDNKSNPHFGAFIGEVANAKTGRAATNLANVRALGVTATVVRVTEY